MVTVLKELNFDGFERVYYKFPDLLILDFVTEHRLVLLYQDVYQISKLKSS